MRTLQQPQQRCTAHQHRWNRSAVAQVRSATQRRSVTASAFDLNFNIGGSSEDAKPPHFKPVEVFQLPKTARCSMQSVLDAQAAAEAEQRELSATGPLAQAAAAGNELVSSILSTYATVQQLYHKAARRFLEQHPQYIGCPAGMAFEICRDILGPEQTPNVQPGSLISAIGLYRLIEAAEVAAVASGQQADVEYAKSLFDLANGGIDGDRHVMPDLITMLTSTWGAFELSAFSKLADTNSDSDWWSAAFMQSLIGVRKVAHSTTSAFWKPTAVQLMLYSCTMPDQPLDITKVDVKVTSAAVEALCSQTDLNSDLYSNLLLPALATLPADDHQKIYAAELELNSWKAHYHSFPGDTAGVWTTLGGLFTELRLSFYSAAFSQLAHTTVMEHLSGSRPLTDWSPLTKVHSVYRKDMGFDRQVAEGWAANNETLQEVLLESNALTMIEATAKAAQERLLDLGSFTAAGVIQCFTAAQIGSCAVSSLQEPMYDWKSNARVAQSGCASLHAALYMTNEHKVRAWSEYFPGRLLASGSDIIVNFWML